MEAILKNPYRTVGLLVGASAKEQDRQTRRLKQFLEADQDPNDDFSLPSLGDLDRTVQIVTDAASKLNLDSDKMIAALFWFYNGNPITDEAAFDALKEANQEACMEIWTKLISVGEVTQRNSSAFQNLSTLLLCNSIVGQTINPNTFEQGVSLKLMFLESDYVKAFKTLATDETYKTSKKQLQLLFLSQLHSEIDRHGGISSNKFLEILNKQDFSAKADFFKLFVLKPIEQIEKQISESKKERKANKADSLNIGKKLYLQTSENLTQLTSILGTSHISCSSITDKLSDEILQCGIDHFSHYKDSITDPGHASMDLFRKANLIAIGNIAKQRCQENIENLQAWIDNKPEREKEAKIAVDLNILIGIIEEFEGKSATAVNAKQLLYQTKPFLSNIKNVLGANDEHYLNISSRIASDAQGMCVSEVNKTQEMLSVTFDNTTKRAVLTLLTQKVNDAYEVTTTIGAMDLNQSFRLGFSSNRSSLLSLKNQLSPINSGFTAAPTTRSGCYIATMAYGDYDHPQVLILREFRDNVLDKFEVGKYIIKKYYHYSPKLVILLKDNKIMNLIIRESLNQIIKLIK